MYYDIYVYIWLISRHWMASMTVGTEKSEISRIDQKARDSVVGIDAVVLRPNIFPKEASFLFLKPFN